MHAKNLWSVESAAYSKYLLKLVKEAFETLCANLSSSARLLIDVYICSWMLHVPEPDLFYRCDYIIASDGQPHSFTTAAQEEIVANVIEPMAADGLRTICIAYKTFVKGEII